jgi:hypothetical protein
MSAARHHHTAEALTRQPTWLRPEDPLLQVRFIVPTIVPSSAKRPIAEHDPAPCPGEAE